jgi:hypothetical protein
MLVKGNTVLPPWKFSCFFPNGWYFFVGVLMQGGRSVALNS